LHSSPRAHPFQKLWVRANIKELSLYAVTVEISDPTAKLLDRDVDLLIDEQTNVLVVRLFMVKKHTLQHFPAKTSECSLTG